MYPVWSSLFIFIFLSLILSNSFMFCFVPFLSPLLASVQCFLFHYIYAIFSLLLYSILVCYILFSFPKFVCFYAIYSCIFHSLLFFCVIPCFILFLFGSNSVCERTEMFMHMVWKVNIFHQCFTSHLRAIMILSFSTEIICYFVMVPWVSAVFEHTVLHIARYPYLNSKCSSEVCLCFLYVWLFCPHWRGLMSSLSQNFSNWVQGASPVLWPSVFI